MKSENKKKNPKDDEKKDAKKDDPEKSSPKKQRPKETRKSKSIFSNAWLVGFGVIVIALIIIAAAILVNRNSSECRGDVCSADEANSGGSGIVVAEVNGHDIYSGDFNKTYDLFLYMQGIPKSYSFLVPESAVLNQTIMQQMIYDDATSHGYSATSQEAENNLLNALQANGYTLDAFKATFVNESFDYDFITEYNRKTMVISKYLNDTILKGITVSESEARAYYDANIGQFNTSEQIRTSHILVNSSELAQQIISQLDNGANFTELAKEYSIDPSVASNGGDLGYFSRGAMVPEFEDAAFALQNIEDYTEQPVQTQYGYHIILLTGREPAAQQTFDQVKDQIMTGLLQQKQNDAVKAYIQSMMANADIKIYLKEQPAASPSPPPSAAPTSDKPVVKLFVMSYCPYGTQMEKGMLPVAQLLGDKIDFQLEFVNYAMHGPKEITENLRQYCIEKEQKDKYLDYLSCFLKQNDSSSCLAETGIDTAKLGTCTEATDQQYSITQNMQNPKGPYPAFLIDDADNKKYGVGGSPTLVINDVTVSSSRDSASLLATVCNAFDVQPEQCSAKLSADSPSPGFGYKTTGTTAQADCTA